MKIKRSSIRPQGTGSLILRGGHQYSRGLKYVPVTDIGCTNTSSDGQTLIGVKTNTDDNLSITLLMPPECFEYFRRLAQNGHTIDLSEYCSGMYNNAPYKKIEKDSAEYNMLVGAKPLNPGDIFAAISKQKHQLSEQSQVPSSATSPSDPAVDVAEQSASASITTTKGKSPSGYSADFWAKEKKRIQKQGRLRP